MATTMDYVRMYANNGFATFPTQNKRPSTPDVNWKMSEVETDSTISKERYRANEFGVVLKADDLVIDLDPRNMHGRKVWGELKKAYAIPPEVEDTMTILSGGGGIHIYLKKPPHVKISKKLSEYPGIEFLSLGCYVIGAGSIHKESGKPYVIHKKGFEIAMAPQALLDAIVRTETAFEDMPKDARKHTDNEDNVNRFIDYLKNDAPIAIEGLHGDTTTFKVACRGRDFNVSSDKCFELMAEHYNDRCTPPWPLYTLKEKVVNAYIYNKTPVGLADPFLMLPEVIEEGVDLKWVLSLDCFKGGNYKPSLRNICMIMENDQLLKSLFTLNEFTEKLELHRAAPWEEGRFSQMRIVNDRDMEHLLIYIVKTYDVEFTIDKVWKGAYIVAGYNRYHPIHQYIESILWDGVSRLDTWLPMYCGSEDNPYVRAIGAKTLIAAVARIYSPGVKFDHVLVLEGKQGIGKSTVCAILGGKWFGDAPLDVSSKDTIEYVHSHWIIEFGEMLTAKRSEVNALKNFITRTEDSYRPPYARVAEKYQRQCIFIGTVNPDGCGYLSDSTGNRRFWPVLCSKIDMAGLRNVRDQLWAEALIRFRAKEPLILSREIAEVAELEAQERMVIDPWFDIIARWTDENPHIGRTSADEIFMNVLGGSYTQIHVGHQRRISQALKRAGWVPKHSHAHGNTYVRPIEISPEEIISGTRKESDGFIPFSD